MKLRLLLSVGSHVARRTVATVSRTTVSDNTSRQRDAHYLHTKFRESLWCLGQLGLLLCKESPPSPSVLHSAVDPFAKMENDLQQGEEEEQKQLIDKKELTQESSSSSSSSDSSDSSCSESDVEEAASSRSSKRKRHPTETQQQANKQSRTHSEMSSEGHAAPSGDCVFCCDDLTEENYVEYRAVPDGPWLKSIYCQPCLETHFIQGQWQKYLDSIAAADCAAALRRVLSAPPPINVKDAGLPCKDNGYNEEVQSFWFSSDKQVHSAKLVGSLEGEARDKFWSEKQAFLTATELQEELAKAEAAKEKEKEKEKEGK